MEDKLVLMGFGAIACVALIYLLVRAFHPVFRNERTPQSGPQRLQRTTQILDAMTSLLERQRALSREITNSIENKARELRDLIRQADETMSRLGAQAPTSTPPTPRPEPRPAQTAGGASLETGTGREERAALFGTVRPVSPIATPLPGSKLSAVEKRRLVYEYADAGMDIDEIAREMQLGKGEVKLILSLRQGA